MIEKIVKNIRIKRLERRMRKEVQKLLKSQPIDILRYYKNYFK